MNIFVSPFRPRRQRSKLITVAKTDSAQTISQDTTFDNWLQKVHKAKYELKGNVIASNQRLRVQFDAPAMRQIDDSTLQLSADSIKDLNVIATGSYKERITFSNGVRQLEDVAIPGTANLQITERRNLDAIFKMANGRVFSFMTPKQQSMPLGTKVAVQTLKFSHLEPLKMQPLETMYDKVANKARWMHRGKHLSSNAVISSKLFEGACIYADCPNPRVGDFLLTMRAVCGATFEVRANPDDPISVIKQKICCVTTISVKQQVLRLEQMVLRNHKSLAFYGILGPRVLRFLVLDGSSIRNCAADWQLPLKPEPSFVVKLNLELLPSGKAKRCMELIRAKRAAASQDVPH